MLVNVTEIDGRRLIIFDSYYPDHGRITNAHYWKRFAGRVCLGEGIVEYVWTPADIVNTLLAFWRIFVVFEGPVPPKTEGASI